MNSKSIIDRISELKEMLSLYGDRHLGEALEIITELQAETEALINKNKELEGKLEIAKNAMKDAIYCNNYYSDPVTAIKVAVKDLENGLEQLNKQGE